MTSSPPPISGEKLTHTPAVESQLSSLVYGYAFVHTRGVVHTQLNLSQNVQVAMDNMLKMINEIDQNSAGIMEEIEKSRESALQRKITLEEEKDHFQKAAFAVLDMLNSREVS